MKDHLASTVLCALTALAAAASLIGIGLFSARRFWPTRYAVVWRHSTIASLGTSILGCLVVLAYEGQLHYLGWLRETGQRYVSGLELGLAHLFVMPVVVGIAAGVVLGVALAVAWVRPTEFDSSLRRRRNLMTIAALVSAAVIFVSFIFPFFLRP